jgi:GNAT superfamily N-acetyltransferase
MAVLQFCRLLTEPPQADCLGVPGLRLRTWDDTADVARWLALQQAAFAEQAKPVRPWTAGDFCREMTRQPWWRSDRAWVVEPVSDASKSAEVDRPLVGAVVLAERRGSSPPRPALHWLMVHPGWRRHGMGRWLVATACRVAWDEGHRQVWLETHSAWNDAVRFYEALGFVPA